MNDYHGLCVAQATGDRQSESRIIKKILNQIRPLPERRGSFGCKENKFQKFIKLIAFGVSDCWYWIGRTDKEGYGTFGPNRAHRVAYEMSKGPIPAGLVVMHSCDVPGCVNPDHLSVGTQQENISDRDRKGRTHKGSRRRKTS